MAVFLLPRDVAAQKSKYYGWWEHKGALHVMDSMTLSALSELAALYHTDTAGLHALAETEIQFYEDSFKLNYGISVANGDGDNRENRWFRTVAGTWQLDNTLLFKMKGRKFTIRENNFTIGEDLWKDSIVNHTLLFRSDSSDLVLLHFNDGSTANGVFRTQKEYPYAWFYLEYGFGNLYTKFY